MPDDNLCVMCDQPAEPGSVSCRDCLEFALESVGAPRDRNEPAPASKEGAQ